MGAGTYIKPQKGLLDINKEPKLTKSGGRARGIQEPLEQKTYEGDRENKKEN